MDIFKISFRERRNEEGGRERERDIDVRNIDQLPPACTPMSDGTHNLVVYHDWESNMQLFSVLDSTPTNLATLSRASCLLLELSLTLSLSFS